MEIVLIFAGSILVGALLGAFIARSKISATHSGITRELESQVTSLTERLTQKEALLTESDINCKNLESENRDLTEVLTATKIQLAQATTRAERIETIEAENSALADENTKLKAQLATEETKRSAAELASQEKLALIAKSEAQLQETFQALSTRVLKESTESLMNVAKSTFEGYQQASQVDLDARQKAIGELVTPISEALKQIEANRHTTTASLTEQIRAMNESYVSLRAETSRLVQALKTPVARGKWARCSSGELSNSRG